MSREPFLSPADAARLLDVTPAAVRQMIRRGALPVAARTRGGIHLLDRAEVEVLAKRRARKGVAHAR